MFYALSWFAVCCLLSLWSITAWAFHAITAWTLASAGTVAGTSGAIEALRLPDWLAPWIAPELALSLPSMLSAFAPYIEALSGWATTLAGGMSLVVWMVWAVGTALLIILGLALSGLIAALRRRSGRPAGFSRGLPARLNNS